MRNGKLLEQIAGTLDGPGHQLREKRYEQRVPQKIVLRFHVLPVNVHQIAHALKGEKRYADRQQDIEAGNVDTQADDAEKLFQHFAGKVEVFEIAQNKQHQYDAARNDPLFFCG